MILLTAYACTITLAAPPVHSYLETAMKEQTAKQKLIELIQEDKAEFDRVAELVKLTMQSAKESQAIGRKILALKGLPDETRIPLAEQYGRELEAHKAKYAALLKEARERAKTQPPKK
jgi:hypothetical protein